MNSEKAELRRYEDDLNVSGTGVVILGAWSVIRALIEIATNAKEIFKTAEINTFFEKVVAVVIILGVIGIISFIIMKVYLYIGLNAMRAAKGKPHKKGYLAAAIIITVISVLSLSSYIDNIQVLKNIDTTIASFLVDITTIYILILVIVSSFRIKKIKKAAIPENADKIQ
ncbi:MAG: hypothetical protein K5668_01545 [Lachnospiraceae bacterium]|nr:hypothetical protein [Lachnospiraceae bacterium]